jgi:hypothetical protein
VTAYIILGLARGWHFVPPDYHATSLINSPGRSNAVALWEKLRSTAGHTHEITEDPQRWEGATRQLLQMLLVPFTDDTFSTKHISALFKAIKEEVEG